MKYYHVYANHKTVKEISHKEYFKLSQRPNFMVCWIDGEDIGFIKNNNVILVSLVQLEQILNSSKEA